MVFLPDQCISFGVIGDTPLVARTGGELGFTGDWIHDFSRDRSSLGIRISRIFVMGCHGELYQEGLIQ